jgi:hypothetical protein
VISEGNVKHDGDGEHYQKGHDYSDAIRQKLGNKLEALQGIYVTIFLSDTHQELPPKSESHQLSSSLAELLLSKLSELQCLQLHRWLKIPWQGQTSRMPRSLKERFLSGVQDQELKSRLEDTWKGKSSHPLYLTMVARRCALPSAPSAPFRVEFAPKGESPDIIRGQLKEAVHKVLEKHYQRIANVKLLLLLYERFWLPRFADDEAVKLAQDELKKDSHPFDEVWYFYPIAEDHKAPNRQEGFLKRLWPANEG